MNGIRKQIPNKLIMLKNNQFRRQDILRKIKFSKILQLSHFIFFIFFPLHESRQKILGNRDNKKIATLQTPNVNTPDKSI